MKRSSRFLAAALLLLISASGAHTQTDPRAWVNLLRNRTAARLLAADTLLSATAQAWAETLAAAAVLSHKGADGTSALDRYRSRGGTEVRVGEILGAGLGLPAVERGWAASPEHLKLAIDPAWTHVGWGSAPSKGDEVWVMLFCEKLVDALSIERTPERFALTGTRAGATAGRPVLYAGLDPLTPTAWDPVSGRFGFELQGPSIPGYFRLGYLTEDGGFRLTNAFTLPRDTESPAGPARSEAPAASP